MNRRPNKCELDIFVSYCPIVKREAVQIFKTEDSRMIAELKDGSAIEYDLVLGTTRSAMNLDILMRPKIATNEEDFKRYFSRKLYRMMRHKNYIQNDISEMTGISTSSLTKYINGTSIPSAYNLWLIANALGCSVDELLTFDC